MTVCMCHRQDISHNDNLSRPADTPDMEYEKHTEREDARPHTHAHMMPLSQLHGVLINKFINGLLIMSAYLPLKHRHCLQTPICAQPHTHTPHTDTHTLYVHIYIKPFSHMHNYILSLILSVKIFLFITHTHTQGQTHIKLLSFPSLNYLMKGPMRVMNWTSATSHSSSDSFSLSSSSSLWHN